MAEGDKDAIRADQQMNAAINVHDADAAADAAALILWTVISKRAIN